MSIDGKWNISVTTPMGPQASSLDLKSDGGKLTGSSEGPGPAVEIYDGTVDGDSATWKIDITQPMPMTLAFSADVDGDSISGQADPGMFPASPFTGSRA
jgi:hypothetical protein